MIDGIHRGDCVAWLDGIDAGSIDLAFADPPFNIDYSYDVYDDARSDEDYLAFCRDWMTGVHKTLKPDGTFWLAIGDEYAAELKVLATQLGFHCRSWVIWYYTFGVNNRRGFSRSHTHLFHFVKDPKSFTFNLDNPAVRVASARQLVYADARANSKGRLPDNTWILRPQDTPPGTFSTDHDTWCFSRVAGTFKERQGFHGCQMPEQLLARIIRLSSNPGEIVIDPFGGSGTTLVVAKKLGRRFAGSELSQNYVDKIRDRLHATEVGDSINGAEDIRSAPSTGGGTARRRADVVTAGALPDIDAESAVMLRNVFADEAEGRTVRELLCDPTRREHFDAACAKTLKLGDPRLWHGWLIRISDEAAANDDATANNNATANDDAVSGPAPSSDLDQFWDDGLDAAEAALAVVSKEYGLDPDGVLAMDEAMAAFDSIATSMGAIDAGDPIDTVSIYRRLAFGLTNVPLTNDPRRRLPVDWTTPDAVDRDAIDATPGIYRLRGAQSPTDWYVGYTANLRNRLDRILQSEPWIRLSIAKLAWAAITDEPAAKTYAEAAMRHRSLLCRLKSRRVPWLNIPRPAELSPTSQPPETPPNPTHQPTLF